MQTLFIEKNADTLKLAVTKDGCLTDFTTVEKSNVNNIYYGRVQKLLQGNDAAFIEIMPGSFAYLSLDKSNTNFKQGDFVIVRIDREAIGSKSARVTDNLVFAGQRLLILPMRQVVGVSKRIESSAERERLNAILREINSEKVGIIARTASYGAGIDEMREEYEVLVARVNMTLKKAMFSKNPMLLYEDTSIIYDAKSRFFARDYDEVITSLPFMLDELKEKCKNAKITLYRDKGVSLFKFYGLDNKIAVKLEKRVELPCGGNIIIERTEAFTVVDVNSGRTSIMHDKNNQNLLVNKEAALELAKQLRYRKIFGMVVVDFIDMEDDNDRAEVRSAFLEESRFDSVKFKVFGFTDMGLFELVRENI
ncbi:MAG: ribonuclease E/G [Clostridia bacterium]